MLYALCDDGKFHFCCSYRAITTIITITVSELLRSTLFHTLWTNFFRNIYDRTSMQLKMQTVLPSLSSFWREKKRKISDNSLPPRSKTNIPSVSSCYRSWCSDRLEKQPEGVADSPEIRELRDSANRVRARAGYINATSTKEKQLNGNDPAEGDDCWMCSSDGSVRTRAWLWG